MKGMFLNPWKTLRALPKIIDFDKNGNMVTKIVSTDNFTNTKTVMESYKKVNVPYSNSHRIKNRSQKINIFDIIQNASGGEPFKPRESELKKLKILLQCTTNICRFLTCPNIRKFCVVCVVPYPRSSKHSKSKLTTCKKISTESLLYHRIVWVPAHTSNIEWWWHWKVENTFTFYMHYIIYKKNVLINFTTYIYYRNIS